MTGDIRLRSVALWLAAALSLWLGARTLERETLVEIQSDGGLLRVTVANSTLSTAATIESVEEIRVHAVASVFPQGGRSIEVSQNNQTVVVDKLPDRFRLPRAKVDPVGDWWVDELAGRAFVYARDVDITGPFTLRAVFTGRAHQHVTIMLRGAPTVAVSFRRGLINNDLHIWNQDGSVRDVTSIDPQPLWDFLSSLAFLGHAAAAAALLIALFHLVTWLPLPVDWSVGTNSDNHRVIFWIAASGLALLGILLSVWFAEEILKGLPHVPDSAVYLLQAKWVLAGQLVQEILPIQDHLTVPFTYVSDRFWVAHYPFGWPVLLSLGVLIGRPWLVAPMLAGLYTMLMFLVGRELYSRSTGLVASLLSVLSPMACILFGSLLSHAASSTLILAALWLLLIGRRREKAWLGLAAGALFGIAFGIRPLAAAAVALPAGLWLVSDLRDSGYRGPAVGVALAATAGGLLAMVPTLVANMIVTGSPLSFPYSLAHGSMYSLAHIPFGIRNMDALLASTVPALFGWGWTMPGAWWWTALPLAFAAVPFLLRRQTHADWLLLGCFAAVVIGHIGTKGHGLHGFGPRYYFDVFFALYLLTARGFQELARIGAEPNSDRVGHRLELSSVVASAALFLVLVMSSATLLPGRLSLYRGYNNVDDALRRQLKERGVDRGLVLFAEDDWRNWAAAAPMMSANTAGDLAFATSLEDNTELFDFYRDRPVFIWKDGSLEPQNTP
jgi:hypothetical protein